jgi:hypothetical protein
MAIATNDEPGDLTQGACGVGPSPLRRLTRREYNNVLRDLLGDSSSPANAFPEEEEMHGFNNNADALLMSTSLVDGYLNAAEAIAANVAGQAASLAGCDPGTEVSEACAKRFIETVGARAFRRPLKEDDVASFLTLYKTGTDFTDGIGRVMEAMLQSPEFLYRVERGLPLSKTSTARKLDSYEVAARLAFFLWGSVPDDTLNKAASEDRLSTAEQVAEQARRMLEDPRARSTVQEFHAQWLRLGRIDLISKDEVAFPTFVPELKDLFKTEVNQFLEDVLWKQQGGGVRELFTANYTYVNEQLASHYGMSANGISGWTRVTLPETRSAGILAKGGLMSVLAKPNDTSPVQRGLFVRHQLLCEEIPPPPDNVELTPPDSDANATAADKLAQHRVPACAGCHSKMDPIGLSFENFDGIGRYRTTDKGKSINPAGEIAFNPIGQFANIPDLGQKLARSAQVQGCLAKNWVRFSYGRDDADTDECTLQTLEEKLVDPSFGVRDLLLLIVQTDAFRYRSTGPAPDGASR